MISLEQALAAKKDRQEFVIKETDYTICFDYLVVLDDSFSDPVYGDIRRNFRGITFNKQTGELLSLPFHKFYNINQNEDSQFIKHKHKKASIYEKLDGTMIHCFVMNGDLIASTCRSFENIQSRDALAFINNNWELKNNIMESIGNGFTPIFEWVAPNNQIVCYYPEPRLVYLMSRDKDTGIYYYEDKFTDRAIKYDFDFADVIDKANIEGAEGFVCHLQGGDIYKVKTKWYLDRHRSIDFLMRPKYKLYEIALNGYLDDVISLCPDAYREILINIDQEVKRDILIDKLAIESEFQNICKKINSIDEVDYRKQFAAAAKTKVNFSGLMSILSGKGCDAFVKKVLLEKYKQKYPYKIMQ